MTHAEKARIIADELQGTCDSLTIALENHEWFDMEMNDEFTGTLDQLVFECTVCNWWCDPSDD